MKKILVTVASMALVASVNAASVGWNIATGSTSYANDAYLFFVTGQNGVESVSTITALLDAGSSADAYAYGTGSVAANGTGIVTASASGKSLGAGTYTSFFVLFDSATPTSGSSKYAVISGASTLTKTVADTTAQVVFASGAQSAYLSDSDNWKAFGSATPTPGPGPDPSDVPEPTTGMLVLLGVAGLALRRRA